MTFYTLDAAKPLGSGALAPAGSVTDPELLKRIAGYKRQIAGRYLAISPEEISTLPKGQMWVSPKIDGHFWCLVKNGEDLALVAPNGKVIAGDLPFLSEARRTFGLRAQGLTIVPGELFALRKDGRPRVSDVSTALAGLADAEVARLGFFAFDLMAGGDATTPEVPAEYPERLEVLERLFAGGQRTRVIKTEILHTPEEVGQRFADWVEGGKGEGLVIRSFDGRIFKLKPFFTLDAAVIGFTEQTDARDHVRSLLLAVMRENGQFQLIGSCGNLGANEQRASLYRQLAATATESKYRFASSTGALFRFVAPKIVVEVKVTDLQNEDGDGRPIRRMVLDFAEASGFSPVQLMAGISLIHPIFVRVRDDKEINPLDIRAGQILERCEIAELAQPVKAPARPKSEVLRREVYQKANKGQKAVRKLVLWRTNKSQDPLFPAFVVHMTDYSPGRQEPLQREVRLAPDFETATALAEEMLVEAVKKGWERVG